MKIENLMQTSAGLKFFASGNSSHSHNSTLHSVPNRRPSWQREMEKVMRATNPTAILSLLYAAETALFLRGQELSDIPDTIEEREAIRAATNDLLDIKINRLKWPDYRRSGLAEAQ
jgi:hypothetical protein